VREFALWWGTLDLLDMVSTRPSIGDRRGELTKEAAVDRQRPLPP